MHIQRKNHSLTIGEQNKIRENTMFSNDKLRRILSLAALMAAAWLMAPGVALAQTSCDQAVYPSDMTCTPDGNAVILDNDDDNAQGAIDLSAVSGGYTLNNNAGATWNPGGFGSGQVGDLGAGNLNNASTIRLGRGNFISAPGTTFTGTGGSVLEMAGAVLDGTGQSNCTVPTTAGCLNLAGGSTAGQTAIRINAPFNNPNSPFADPIDEPVSPGVVLVDVGGGSSRASHFILDPGSDNYATDSKYGSVIDTGGLFDYALLYDPTTQQHLLASVPQREGLEYVARIKEALSIWHTTSDAIAGRQADLRDGATSGGWVRIIGEQTDRDAAPTLTTHGNSFTYDQSYSIYTGAAIAGYDLTSGDDHVIGAHAGLLSSETKFEGSNTADKTKGITAGAYGGWWQDGLTLDGTINLNLLNLDHKVSTDFERSSSDIRSLGARVEAGWRVPMGDALYIQPLATGAYIYSDVKSLDLRDYDIDFKNTQSLRAALGLRLGGDATIGENGKLGYWLVARAWDEFEGDGNIQFATSGDSLVIKDDLSGSFQEIGFGVEATNAEGDLSAYFSGGATFGNDTDSYNFSLGTRLRW